MTINHIIDEGLDVLYEPRFIEPNLANIYLLELINQADWHKIAMPMYDKIVYSARKVAWHADSGFVYRYSGQEHTWNDWTPAIIEIRKIVEKRMGRGFNGVLLNLYENGKDYVSFHADDEKDMANDVPIVAVSLGATRDFVFKHINGNKYTFSLESGSLVIMSGETQKVSKHSIPKRTKINEPRVSLTFRQCIRQKKGLLYV